MFAFFRKLFLGVPLKNANFARMGFPSADVPARQTLESYVRTAMRGHNLAVTRPDDLRSVAAELDALDAEFRGFAYEGAATGFALLDAALPWRNGHWRAFADGPGARYLIHMHVGLGCTLAMVRRDARALVDELAAAHPLYAWSLVDGYGFMEGYLHWQKYFRDQHVQGALDEEGRHVFDEGLGRCAWIVFGGASAAILSTLSAFPASRQVDLFNGVGIASAYTGGVERPELLALRDGAGDHAVALRQGVAFGAHARFRSGTIPDHTELAAQTVCGMAADELAAMVDSVSLALTAGGSPAFATWKSTIRSQLETVPA